MKRTLAIVPILFLLFLMVIPALVGGHDIGKWEMYEIELTTTITYSNPFTEVNLSATFTSPKGRQLKVAGFYDGDGQGGQNGTIWTIRVMPDEIGDWTYRTTSTDPQLDGIDGSFKCIDSNNRGLLIRDQNYSFSMKFVDGAHFFQNGCDDPEDFLAVQYDPQQERFEAIDYLTSVGVNELYIGLVNGCPGDGGRNSRVEPWLGDGCPPDFYRLDLSDIHKWDATFKYMNDKGMVAHLVLLLEDSGGLTTPLKNDWNKMEFYLKEMIARFGAYPNVIWNIAEEYGEFLSDDQVREIAQYLKDNDPYCHIVTVHQNHGASFNFAADNRFDLTALQYGSVDPSTLNNVILTVRNEVESSGRKIPVSITEWTQIDPAQIDQARKGIWAIAMGGGTYEIHLNTRELNTLDDFNKWDTIWKQANILRQFMANISYYEMKPNNSIITSGGAFALEKSGTRYVAYLYNGGPVTVDLSSASGTLEVGWYNPRNGTYYDERTVTGGGKETFTPPFRGGDAVLHIFTTSARWDSGTQAEAVKSQPLAGQIIVDPNTKSWPAYNRDSNGDGKKDPFFLCGPGDPESFLYRGTRNVDGTRKGDQMEIIIRLKGTGANSIYMQAIRSHGGDGNPTHNPFVDSDPTKAINGNILNQWETWFTEMDNNGIVIFLVLYDDNMKISEIGSNRLSWPLDNSGNLHPQERYYIEAIVKRFEQHRHLIWCVMEEVEEMGSDYVEHAKKIAETIRQSDDHDHVIAVHKRNGLFYEFEDDPNFNQFIPEYHSVNCSLSGFHDGMVSCWNTARGRYNINMQECNGPDCSDTTHIRKGCWAVAMGGGYILIAHINPLKESITLFQDCGRLVRFMESLSLSEMAPHDEVVTSGTGYCLANLGCEYAIYLFDGGSVTVDLSDASGSLDVEWYDPTDGTYYDEGQVTGGGSEIFTPPFSGDAVLHIFTIESAPDTTSPSAVTDLAASGHTSYSIALTWTAPGDDGNSGTATLYDIRYSTSEISGANWNAATQCTGEPNPQIAGSNETFTVIGLSSSATYYFALKAADEVLNWSDLSNCVNETTVEETNLVAEWHLDEGSGPTAVDTSGNGNDGTIYGASWTDGKRGKGLSFDGTDDYIDCGQGSSLKITGAITVEAWVKWIGAGNPYFVTKAGGPGRRSFDLSGNADGNIRGFSTYSLPALYLTISVVPISYVSI
jgi:hypothetical protein